MRMIFIKERIDKGIDNWGEYTVFCFLNDSKSFLEEIDYIKEFLNSRTPSVMQSVMQRELENIEKGKNNEF